MEEEAPRGGTSRDKANLVVLLLGLFLIALVITHGLPEIEDEDDFIGYFFGIPLLLFGLWNHIANPGEDEDED